ncbi:MAG: Gfo/Idh/MocA family oxidoreductase [Dysgonamonadaceae bacterium]|nr:Gfo/Idh/MocA family oxidoreductase [Dysgonamonadaceae bacterium]
MEKINAGLIGYGMAGQLFHAPFLYELPGFNLAKIYTTNPNSVALANRRYPETTIVDQVTDIINDAAIDVVFVLTPNVLHFELAKAALLAGKHVVIDKPITSTVAQADELIALAKKTGKLLTVYQNRRFASDYKTAKKLVESGVLGKIVEFSSCFDRFVPTIRPKKWKEEGFDSGVLYDLGAHQIDQILQLFGMPLEVTANIRYQRENTKIDDYYMLTLQYPELTVYLHSGMLVKAPGPVFLIQGTQGAFIKYGMDIQEGELDKGKKPVGDDWGKEPQSLWGTLKTSLHGLPLTATIESERGDYMDFFINLRDAINGNCPLAVNPEDSRNVVKIIELAFQSAKEKRTVAVK